MVWKENTPPFPSPSLPLPPLLNDIQTQSKGPKRIIIMIVLVSIILAYVYSIMSIFVILILTK